MATETILNEQLVRFVSYFDENCLLLIANLFLVRLHHLSSQVRNFE